MTAASLVFQQVAIMFLLILAGAFLTRRGMLSPKGASELSTVLLYLIVPALIIRSFIRPVSTDLLIGLGLSVLLAFLFHLLAIKCSQLLHGKSIEETAILRMGSIYSNCGFMAFPILDVLYGDLGVFYGSVFVAVFNIFLWSHGVWLLKPHQKVSSKKAILNPGCIPVLVGCFLFIFGISIPNILNTTFGYLAATNTPIAMIVIGIYLAKVPIKSVIGDRRIWQTSILKVLVIPIIFLLLMLIVNAVLGIASFKVIYAVMIICCACPTASSVLLLPSAFGMKETVGVKIVLLSTILSLVSIPMITMLTQWLLFQ